MKSLIALSLASFAFFIVTSITYAGGGAVWFDINPTSSLNPGEQYVVHAHVQTQASSPNFCKNCYIKLAFQNPQSSDYLSQNSEYTDDNGEIYAKVTSQVPGARSIYVSSLKNSDGSDVTSEAVMTQTLNYTGGPTIIPTPIMEYPQDGQIIDLEGAYMFKVSPGLGASGYLFGFSQDGKLVYENYRDSGTLSSNGEFALWESNKFHKKFHEGQMIVIVRGLVNDQWSEATTLTIDLKSRTSTGTVSNTTGGSINTMPSTTSKPILKLLTPPNINSQTVTTTIDSSASAELQKKVDELENKLEESQQKQSILEQRINDLVSWIKSVFPFFK